MAAKAYLVQLMLDAGFLATTGFYAMHAHTPEHVAAYLGAADAAFAEIARADRAGDLKAKLRGAPSAMGFRRLC